MSESRHTPGSWGVKWHVAHVQCGSDNAEANARLIAAAPDMLAALISTIKWNDTPKHLSGPFPIKQITEAVAKATGDKS